MLSFNLFSSSTPEVNVVPDCSRQDVARLIVERSTIMNSLFSKHSGRPESDAVLSAFLTIFSAYIKRMRKTKEGEDLYSWVSITNSCVTN